MVISILIPKKTRNLKLISIYLFAGLFTDLFLNPISKLYFNSPFFASKIFTATEFVLISLYLFPLIQLKTKKIFFLVSSFIFFLTVFTENVLNNNQNFDSASTGVSALIILFFSIAYLFSRIKYNTNPENFKIDGSFLVVSSIIIYFSGTFFIYILSKNNYFDENFRLSYSLINALVLIVRNILILTAFITELKPYLKKETLTHTSKYSI